MPRYYTVEQGKNTDWRSDKMAAQNEPNFALFTSSDLGFLTDELFTEMDFLTEQTETLETINVAVITEEREQTERNEQQLDDQDVYNFIVYFFHLLVE